MGVDYQTSLPACSSLSRIHDAVLKGSGAKRRRYEGMNRSFSLTALTAVFITFLVAVPVQAESGFYVSGELGMNFGESLDSTGSDNDRVSVCDEYLNPGYRMIASCTEPRTGGDAWNNSFGSDEGILFGAAIGYRFKDSRFRVELEYFYRDTGYEETSTIDFGADPQTVEKINNELLVAAERIDSLISHNLFANLYMDFANDSKFTPYVGVGVGFGMTDMDFGLVAQRRLDPNTIFTVPDTLPDVRSRLAGTATILDKELDDTLFGYQVMAGVDYALTESLLLGVKGRWVSFDSFKDGSDYNSLRSHPSNLRLDGSEPVEYKLKVDDIEMFGVSMNLKYLF